MAGLLGCELLIGLPTDDSGMGDGGGSKLGETVLSLLCCCGGDNAASAGRDGDGMLASCDVDCDSTLEKVAGVSSPASPLRGERTSMSVDDFECSLLVEGVEDSILVLPACGLEGFAWFMAYALDARSRCSMPQLVGAQPVLRAESMQSGLASVPYP